MILVYIALAAATLVLCLLARRIGDWLKIVDYPDGTRKVHRRETPLVGGIAVILPVVSITVALAASGDFAPLYWVLAASMVGFLTLGLLDDRRHLRPAIRLGTSALACLGFLWAVPDLDVTFLKFSFLPHAIYFDTDPIGLPMLTGSALFTVLCLVGLQNAINMADGENGLVIGLSLLWVALLTLFAPAHLLPLLIVFLACLLVTLAFNLAGRLFLGDSGTYAIAMAMALLTVYVYKIGFARLPADMVMLWFLIPVVDTLRLMLLRGLTGSSPLRSDRNHFHHRIQRLVGWPWSVALYLGIVGAPSILALMHPKITLIWVVLALSAYGIVMGLSYRGARQVPTGVSPGL